MIRGATVGTFSLFLLIACGAKSAEDLDSESEDLAAPADYTNPILPMVDRPPGVSRDVPAGVPHDATEGCPDPSGLRTKSGAHYLYCTSYTFKGSRLNGFPIWKSRSSSIAGPYKQVSALIPDDNGTRKAWPSWVSPSGDGDFWGPDVKELPDGKFYAGYSAPCLDGERCVGVAWADQPEGPWTHASAPFIRPDNNGVGKGDAYDPSLLITSTNDLFLYWTVPGRGVFGAAVTAKGSGELNAVSESDTHLIADHTRGQRGEGPYVIEHGGAFYEFYSTGSLEYSYHVGVRRGTDPLALFDVEAPSFVVEHNAHFDATGGNSVVHDGARDWLVYHAIVVPNDGGCPRENPVYGGPVTKVAANPHCRVQGERQAMIDPLVWEADAKGIEWPSLANGRGTPSVGKTAVP